MKTEKVTIWPGIYSVIQLNSLNLSYEKCIEISMENTYADIAAWAAYEHDYVKLDLTDFQFLLHKNVHSFRPVRLRCFFLLCWFSFVRFFPLTKYCLVQTSYLFHEIKFIEN